MPVATAPAVRTRLRRASNPVVPTVTDSCLARTRQALAWKGPSPVAGRTWSRASRTARHGRALPRGAVCRAFQQLGNLFVDVLRLADDEAIAALHYGHGPGPPLGLHDFGRMVAVTASRSDLKSSPAATRSETG